jgi:hypothetical protein
MSRGRISTNITGFELSMMLRMMALQQFKFQNKLMHISTVPVQELAQAYLLKSNRWSKGPLDRQAGHESGTAAA